MSTYEAFGRKFTGYRQFAVQTVGRSSSYPSCRRLSSNRSEMLQLVRKRQQSRNMTSVQSPGGPDTARTRARLNVALTTTLRARLVLSGGSEYHTRYFVELTSTSHITLRLTRRMQHSNVFIADTKMRKVSDCDSKRARNSTEEIMPQRGLQCGCTCANDFGVPRDSSRCRVTREAQSGQRVAIRPDVDLVGCIMRCQRQRFKETCRCSLYGPIGLPFECPTHASQ